MHKCNCNNVNLFSLNYIIYVELHYADQERQRFKADEPLNMGFPVVVQKARFTNLSSIQSIQTINNR